MIYKVSHKIQKNRAQILRRRASMMRFFLLLSCAAICLTLPIKEDTLDNSDPPEFTTNTSKTKTSPATDVFISSLLPPTSISQCLTSGSQVPQPTYYWKWVGVSIPQKVGNFSLRPSSTAIWQRSRLRGCLLSFYGRWLSLTPTLNFHISTSAV